MQALEKLVEQVAVRAAQVVRRVALEAAVERYLVHKMVEVAQKVAVVCKDIAEHRATAVRMDTVD